MKREMLEVVDARPPNFDAIKAVLPDADKPGVMFAYGGKVYYPGARSKVLTRELDAHERVHVERQAAETEPGSWWAQYLTDAEFRFNEELLAHQAEYRMFCKRHANPVKQWQYLRTIAGRLCSPLYGETKVPVAQAMIWIRSGV